MKRLIILAMVLACSAALCIGQRRQRTLSRKIVQLPQPQLRGALSFEEALAKRRSVRQFANKPLNFTQVGQLAWAGQGITDPIKGLRTAPSAGETYPIELYIAGPEGLFLYRPSEHSLEQMTDQDIRASLATAAGMQEAIARAPCSIIVAGSLRKISARFRTEARKFLYMEAGHIAQNIQLQAVCMNLGSVPIGGFDVREIERVCKLQKDLDPLYIISVGYPVQPGGPEGAEGLQPSPGVRPAAGKKAVFIICRQDFRDDELYETRRILDTAGVETIIAGAKVGVARGMLGNIAEVRMPLNQVVVDDYDAVVFIGGSGVVEYFDDPVALNIARQAAAKKKVLAAISMAPTILANAKVLTGVRATSLLSEKDKLQQAGAVYTGAPVERDGLIITGTGGIPIASVQFGRAIAEALSGR